MSRAYYYDLKTGLFNGKSVYTSNDIREAADLNCPAGYGWKVGIINRSTQRVDVATGDIAPIVN